MPLSSVIQNIPVDWAEEAKFYHENEYGEPWIATVREGKILISGCDIGWTELSLTYDEAVKVHASMKHGQPFVIKETVFDYGEFLWILSIIQSSFYMLRQSSIAKTA